MELKTKTTLFILASFLLGGIAGGFVGKTYFTAANNGHRPSKEEFQKHFVQRLKLDSTQASIVDTIFEAHRKKFSEVRKLYTERFQLDRDTLRGQIRRILSPEQNTLFDEFIKEQDERDKKKKEGFK